MGKTKKQILKMDQTEINEFLKDHNVNAVFAIAKYLQGADAKNKLSLLSYN